MSTNNDMLRGLLAERKMIRNEMILKGKESIRAAKSLLAMSEFASLSELRIDAALAALKEARHCQERYDEAVQQIAEIERELA